MSAKPVSDASARRRRTAGLLSGCAIGLALAAAPHSARAQAFQGTPSVVAGSTIITTPTATTTDVLVRTNEVVINWTPFDVGTSGNIDFLPAGSVATFTDGSLAQYTVLNRILPVDGSGFAVARAIELNGAVNSTLGGVPGGNIWFYTPTGFVVGSTATMQVGGLVLTTDDIVFGAGATGGTTLFGPGNTVFFRGAPNVISSVVIQPGAQITANGINSYVAMVSPRIDQGGTVSANRSIGYVGAEQVDIAINAGLFDISILAGTTDSVGVSHTGTTTGAASASSADVKQISLIAMPKSTALTMMLQGAIGYAAAASASNDGSAVILSSGFAAPVPSAELASSLGNIAIDNATFVNPTNAYASGRLDITAAAGNTGFGSTSTLFAQDAIGIDLSGGGNVGATSNLSLLAGRGGIGGAIDITLGSKGNLAVNGLLTINASSNGTPLKVSPPLDATGGTIDILVDNGALSAQALVMAADAYGQYDPMQGGNAIGGSISLSAVNGGSVTSNSLDATASAGGGSSDTTGGNAIGGTISISSESSILAPGGINLYAYGESGAGAALSGTGTGGHIAIDLSGGTYAWDYLGAYAVGISDSATGGQGNSALALADAIDLTLTNGANLSLLDDTSFDASAYASADGAAGVAATGGGINISVLSGSILNFTYIQALAQAGVNLVSFAAPNSTPAVNGGSIQFNIDSGQVNGEHLSLDASAYGLGAVNSAGSATGGSAGVDLLNDSQLTLDDGAGTAELSISADGLGAIGPAAANAFGGTALLSNSDSAVTVLGTIGLSGAAYAHDESSLYVMGLAPITGFDATGGSATVVVTTSGAGVASLATTDLTTDATGDARTPVFFFNGDGFSPGFYGGPIAGNSGNGTGGSSDFAASGSSTVALSSLRIVSDGFGGISQDSPGTAYTNGDGAGGTTAFSSTGGSQTITSLSLSARGTGGTGADAGISSVGSLAGNGTGGSAVLTIDAGALTAPTLSIDATGTGGVGTAHLAGGAGTDGGSGQGGSARLDFVPGATGSLTTDGLDLNAQGYGGNGGVSAAGPGGSGGDGTGGTAATKLADGAFSLGPFRALADGNGGDGSGIGIGGEGHGGSAGFSLIDTTGPSGARSVDSMAFYASGVGGNDGASAGGGIAGSDAGSVSIVVSALNQAAALSVNGPLEALSRGTRGAIGDGFTATIAGAPLTIGGSVGIDTARDATITAAQPWNVNGPFTMFARSLTETGTISATGNVGITAPGFITAENIASGGTTTLLAANGPLAVTDLTSVGDVTAQAQSIDIASSGPLSIAFAQATAGDLSFLTAGNLGIQFASSTGAMTLDSTTGAVTATGPVSASGDLAVSGDNGISLLSTNSGGAVLLTSANAAVGVTALTAGGLVTANGSSIDIASSGGLSFADVQAASGNVQILTTGNLLIGNGGAAGNLDLTSTSGIVSDGVFPSGSGNLSAGGTIALDGNSGISFAGLSSDDTVSIASANGTIAIGDLQAGGPVSASGLGISLASSGGLNIANATAAGGDLSVSTAGNLMVGGASATGGVSLASSGGDLRTTGAISGNAIDLAGGAIAADAAITSAGPLTIDARGTLSIGATATGTSITASAADIAIAAGGQLGTRGQTLDLTLINRNPAAVTTIGDTGMAGGFALSNAEAGRLFADQSITLSVAPSTAPTADLVIGTLEMMYGATGNIGAGGVLKIDTGGRVAVNGAVTLATTSVDDTFSIDPSRIDVIAGSGSIIMATASGTPTGRLELDAGTIAVADQPTLDAIAAAPSFAAISSALDAPGAAGPPGGYLQAGSIEIDAVDALYIQNSGVSSLYADRLGFTADSLFITTASPNTRIAINGVVAGATGLDTVGSVTINDIPAAAGGRFDPLSSVNGCIIGANCLAVTPEPGNIVTNPTADELDQPLPEASLTGALLAGPLVQMQDNAPLIPPPLVDEPITGVGNDDLWQVQCDSSDEACPAREDGE